MEEQLEISVIPEHYRQLNMTVYEFLCGLHENWRNYLEGSQWEQADAQYKELVKFLQMFDDYTP